MSFCHSQQLLEMTTTASDFFKEETACGLISQEVNLKGKLDPHDELMITGEELLVNGQCFGPMEWVALPAELRTIESYEMGSHIEWSGFVRNYAVNLSGLGINSPMPSSKRTPVDLL